MINKVDIKVNYHLPALIIYPADLDNGPNLERIDAALAAIDASPVNWNQGHWAIRDLSLDEEDTSMVVVKPAPSCGTAMCLAGHVVTQAGYYILFEEGEEETAEAVDANGRRYFIENLAQSLLNLNESQAKNLFEYRNTRDDLQYQRNQIEQSASNRDEV